MVYREVPTIEMQEVIRRWQAGNSQRQIAVRTGLSRDTVHKYVAATQGEGIARDGPAPVLESKSAGESHSSSSMVVSMVVTPGRCLPMYSRMTSPCSAYSPLKRFR